MLVDSAATDRSSRHWAVARLPLALTGLLAAAFLARLAVRLAFGESYFWSNSYYIYYRVAQNIAGGSGFCLPNGCAWEPPLYPLFLTFSVFAGKSWWLVVVPQALIGAGTAWCASAIGRELFDRRTGILACAITAVYPYYVMHDTALQDTGMVTFATAAAVFLLLRASRLDRYRDWFVAGASLGVLPLVRASVALGPVVGLIWCISRGASGTVATRLCKAAALAVAVAIMIGPWLAYTYRSTGVPVITSQNGYALWMGNNPDTFSHYPTGSIDRSRDQAVRNLSAADRAELSRLQNDEIARSDWFAHRALQFMAANPLLVAKNALRKIAAGFSWKLNPARDSVAEAAYAVGYVPVALLGILGMILARDRPGTVLVGLLFLAFIVVTAVFWAHTSHRTYLDVYWIVFAAAVTDRIWARARTGPAPPADAKA